MSKQVEQNLFVLLVTKISKLLKSSISTTTPYETIDKTVAFFKRFEEDLAGIAIGSFGPIDIDQNSETYGYITSTPKPHWANVDLVGLISKLFKVPFFFTTDVNSSAYGETIVRKGVKSLVYYTIGTGIGAGAIQMVNSSAVLVTQKQVTSMLLHIHMMLLITLAAFAPSTKDVLKVWQLVHREARTGIRGELIELTQTCGMFKLLHRSSSYSSNTSLPSRSHRIWWWC